MILHPFHTFCIAAGTASDASAVAGIKVMLILAIAYKVGCCCCCWVK